MKTLLVLASLLYAGSTFAAGESRTDCGKGQGQQQEGQQQGKKGKGQGQQQQQQQCQQQQQQESCNTIYNECLNAGYVGTNAVACVDNVLIDKETELDVNFGDKMACLQFKNEHQANYDAWKKQVVE